jgi:serine/threonine protein kinase
MSVPSSVEELLQLIRKSGMVDEQKLGAYLQRRQLTRGLPGDPRQFADEMVQDGILTYFQSEQFLLGKWRGFTIGKFKLLERVGVGGMGQVFLCEHMFMRKRVAVKVLPPAKADQPAALGRFYREARAAGSLDHPNIIRTHDIDQDGNLHFIVMDYVDGPNLLDVVKKFGPMDLRRAVHYVRQAALGLDYAFRNHLIHRDIKPGNILIDRRGTAKILDMGLARFLNDAADQLTMKPRSRSPTATRWTSGRTSTRWARPSTSSWPGTRPSRSAPSRRSSSGTARRTRPRSARSGPRCPTRWRSSSAR